MHEIEKYAVAHKLFLECWQNYSVVYGVKMPSLPQFDAESKAMGTAGFYYFASRKVWINLAFYQGGDTSNLRETIAHEIAHHLCRMMFPNAPQSHGPQFKNIMQSIGYDGNRCHSMSVAMAKQVAKKDKEQLFNLD